MLLLLSKCFNTVGSYEIKIRMQDGAVILIPVGYSHPSPMLSLATMYLLGLNTRGTIAMGYLTNTTDWKKTL